MKYACLPLLFVLYLFFNSCGKIENDLTRAESFVVVAAQDIELISKDRNSKMWYITSSANDFDSFAQTTIKAAIDIHKKNKEVDLIQVCLVPDKELVASSLVYAFVYYASDGKGMKYVSGADQQTMIEFKWLVRATAKPLTVHEQRVAELWMKHMDDFPSEDPLSSLSYNREKLVGFIAAELDIDPSKVYFPAIEMKEYKELDFLTE